MSRKSWLVPSLIPTFLFFLLLAILGVVANAELPAASHAPVPYPKGYREWTHVKSMVIGKGHSLFDSFGGIHHIYANEAAMAGYRSGRFSKGAIIVFDLLEATSADGAITEGARKVLGVMRRDERRYAATGGWGFEGFASGDPANRVVGADASTACFSCHTTVAESQFVFSRWRD